MRPWPSYVLDPATTTLTGAVFWLLDLFDEKGMKARQLVITGEAVPSDNPATSILGLPVGWLSPRYVGRGSMDKWVIEMVGVDFAYASCSVAVGKEIVLHRPPKRQPIMERVQQEAIAHLWDNAAKRL